MRIHFSELSSSFLFWKVSDRVERRLQAIEQEIHAERQLVERRQDQLGHMSVHLQEVSKKEPFIYSASEN